MNLYKTLKRVYSKTAERIYQLTAKKDVMKMAELYDTPTMTRYHHIVSALRYVAVEEHYGKNDFGKDLYIHANHWESEKALQEDLERFDVLIRSIETKGYDSNSAIFVDLNRNCFNGTHRLALCAWFGIKEIPVKIIGRRLKTKSMAEMKAYYHLSEEDYGRLEAAYQRMRANFSEE